LEFCQVIVEQFIASAEDKWRRLTVWSAVAFMGSKEAGRSIRVRAWSAFLAWPPTTTPGPDRRRPRNILLPASQVKRHWRKPLCDDSEKLCVIPSRFSLSTTVASGFFQRILPDPKGRRPRT